MTGGRCKVLVIGYGNLGRLDDGLGPALAAELEKLELDDVTIDADYQLTVEDAAAIAEHDVAIFADASVSGDDPFFLKRIEPVPAMSFSSHSVEPSAAMALAAALFKVDCKGYALGIRGYEFNEFGERLSEAAKVNLLAALEFVVRLLKDETFRKTGIVGDYPASPE